MMNYLAVVKLLLGGSALASEINPKFTAVMFFASGHAMLGMRSTEICTCGGTCTITLSFSFMKFCCHYSTNSTFTHTGIDTYQSGF